MSEPLRARLAAFGIRPRRQLGQHFLHDPNALAGIAAAVGADDPPAIVEIGPGPGTLTDHLAQLGPPLVAVEKDPDLVRLLRHRFRDQHHVDVREGDFLKHRFAGPTHPAVVGNIPYNISTPIILHLLSARDAIGPTTLMLQAELAERLRSPVGSRASGSFTVLLALVAEVRRLMTLAPGAFFPPPKVHSEVVQIHWREAPAVPVEDVAGFERVVRTGFGRRRKTLRNALTATWSIAQVEQAGKEARIDLRRRAETLDLREWAALTRSLVRVG